MLKTLIASLLLLLATLASAEEVYTSAADIKPGRFQTYLHARETYSGLNDIGLFWDKLLGLQQTCEGAHEVRPLDVVLLDPVVFPDAGDYPTRGIWKVRFQYWRCNDFKTYNALFTATGGTKPQLLPAIPGFSQASPALAMDALKSIFPQVQAQLAKLGAADCKLIYPFEARMTPAAMAKPQAETWQERWTFQGCGKQTDMMMTFNPKAVDGKFFLATPLP
jgi:hypothetical protein